MLLQIGHPANCLQIACFLFRTQLVVLYDLLHTGVHLCPSTSKQQVDCFSSIDIGTGTYTGTDAGTGTDADTDTDADTNVDEDTLSCASASNPTCIEAI